jgi:hypothetical protein
MSFFLNSLFKGKERAIREEAGNGFYKKKKRPVISHLIRLDSFLLKESGD